MTAQRASLSFSNSASRGILPGLVRFAPTAVISLVWAHALGRLAAKLGEPPGGAAAWAFPLTLGALAVSAVAAATSPRATRPAAAMATGVLATVAVGVVTPGAGWTASVLAPVGMFASMLSGAIGRRLPETLQDLRPEHRTRVVLWAGVTLLAVMQMARLSTWVSDPNSDWFLTTRDPFWAKHECLSAYIHGAELGLRGEENLYAAAHYPGLTPGVNAETNIAHMVVEDPFQYAPPFLLLPAVAIGLTHDYPVMRSVWFAFQTTAFLFFAGLLALWIGGRVGRLALWLLPLTLSAFPVLHNLQYGQFHLAAVALGVAAMVAFDRGRDGWRGYRALGGTMLAVATLSKIFPGVLLLVLASQRRFRELAWAAGAALVLCLGTLAVFGSAPYLAFAQYHLPRLQSGAAFAFGDAWPEVRQLIIAANHGMFGTVIKLAELGVPGAGEELATQLNRAFGVLVALGALALGPRIARADRAQRAAVWLALLGLGSMMSTGAFADYVPLTATWLLTLLASRMARPRAALGLGIIWVFQYALLFVAPLGDWFDPAVFLPLSTASTLMMLGLFAWAITVSVRQASTTRAQVSAAGVGVPERLSQPRWGEV